MDCRCWIENLHQFDPSSTPKQHRGAGPVGMSRDSLPEPTSLLQSSHNRRGQHMPASHIAGIGQATPIEMDLRTKMATITIQRWYRKIHMRRKMAEAALKRFDARTLPP